MANVKMDSEHTNNKNVIIHYLYTFHEIKNAMHSIILVCVTTLPSTYIYSPVRLYRKSRHELRYLVAGVRALPHRTAFIYFGLKYYYS